MTTTAPLTALNPLQKDVARALGEGMLPNVAREHFALTTTSLEAWRGDALFVAEVERVRAQALNPSNSDNFSALDAALGEAFGF